MEMRICGESQQITLPAWASCAPNHSVHRGRPHEWATESPGLRWFFRGGKWRMRWGKIWWYNLVGGFYHLEKYDRQWEGLSHILWKIKNVWNHQPVVNIWWRYHGDKWSYPTWVHLKMGIWWVLDQESMAIEWEYEGDATNKNFCGVDNALPYYNHSWKVKH